MTTNLLCLHGMACTGRVWDGLADVWSEGAVIAPDLAGHGTAPTLNRYGVEAIAADLQTRVLPNLPAGDRLVLVGHSMGGAVASVLAGASDAADAMVSVGVKTSWSADEVEGSAAVAAKGVRLFADAAAATDRYLKVSGLFGLVDPASTVATSGVVETDEGWRMRSDPQAFGAPPPDFSVVLPAIAIPYRLGRGSDDAMVPASDLVPYDADFFELAGTGHNAHVEDPEALAAVIRATIDALDH